MAVCLSECSTWTEYAHTSGLGRYIHTVQSECVLCPLGLFCTHSDKKPVRVVRVGYLLRRINASYCCLLPLIIFPSAITS